VLRRAVVVDINEHRLRKNSMNDNTIVGLADHAPSSTEVRPLVEDFLITEALIPLHAAPQQQPAVVAL